MNNNIKELIKSFFIISQPEFNIYVKDERSTDGSFVNWSTWYGDKPLSPLASAYAVIISSDILIHFRENKSSEIEIFVIISIFDHDKKYKNWCELYNTLTKYHYIEIEYEEWTKRIN